MTLKRKIGFVQNGKYVQVEPGSEVINHREHPLHRQYIRDRMREQYSREIVQPYKHGQVNEQYIDAFGKEEAIRQGMVTLDE